MARNRRVEDDNGKEVNLQNLARESRYGYNDGVDEYQESMNAADEEDRDLRPWAGIYADDEERKMVEEMEAAIDRRIAEKAERRVRPPSDTTASPAVQKNVKHF